MAMMKCKECGKDYSDKADKCPDCGCPNPHIEQRKQKKEGKKWDLIVAILLFIVPLAPIGIILSWVKKVPRNLFVRVVATLLFGFIFIFWATGGTNSSDNSPSDSNPKQVGSVDGNAVENEDNAKNEDEQNKIFKVGDVVETSDMKITYISAKKYKEKNEFSKPKKGNVYYRMQFEFENKSDSDQGISSMVNWKCYADGYSAEQYFGGEDDMDTQLSPGKKIKGSVYFEVPKDAKEITLEYECNFWTEDKVVFKVK